MIRIDFENYDFIENLEMHKSMRMRIQYLALQKKIIKTEYKWKWKQVVQTLIWINGLNLFRKLCLNTKFRNAAFYENAYTEPCLYRRK